MKRYYLESKRFFGCSVRNFKKMNESLWKFRPLELGASENMGKRTGDLGLRRFSVIFD